jgi:hypothetical protein
MNQFFPTKKALKHKSVIDNINANNFFEYLTGLSGSYSQQTEVSNDIDLSCLPKTCSTFSFNQITDFVSQTINKMQFGFKKSNSTTDALFYIKNQIIMSRNANCYCAVISLDLEKAFGSVPHHLLMIELFTLGFDDIVLHLFKSYLSKRTQFVFFGAKQSQKDFH